MTDPKRVAPPRRDEVKAMLLDLLHGRKSRQEASEWASSYLSAERLPGYGHDWHFVEAIFSANAPGVESPYLFDESDYQDWLDQLQALAEAKSHADPVPRWRQVVYPSSGDLQWDAAQRPYIDDIVRHGIPRACPGNSYQALASLHPEGSLICFGRSTLEFRRYRRDSGDWFEDPSVGERFAVDPDDGTVVFINYHASIEFVNTSLDRFRAAIHAFIDEFPYYSIYDDGYNDDIEITYRGVGRARRALARTDPGATATSTWWAGLFSDMEIGEYATERLLDD